MKNLEALYARMGDRGIEEVDFKVWFEPVIAEQTLFTLTSCEGDTGYLLRSDNGDYHIWFVGRTTTLDESGAVIANHVHVTETSTWYPNQLNDAMKFLMLQMQLDCEGLIERNGEPA